MTWIRRDLISIPNEIMIWNLGDGESEALSWAYNNRDTFVAVIDDRAARNCAKTLGINILGTGGILLLAKRRGFITSVTDAMRKLRDAGLYISDEIAALLIEKAGE